MIENILKEISRLKKELEGYSASEALDYIEAYINAVSKEPASEDLEESARYYLLNTHTSPLNNILHQADLKVEMQYHKDIEDAYKAGAEEYKQHMKETLQTEYEKGRFDMREEMMKDAVEGTVKYEIGSAEIPQCDRRYQVLSDPAPIANAKLGDKVKIIIVKED